MAQRVALVTGAARGIGAATVDALCAEGYGVVAVDLAADLAELPYALGTAEELAAVAERHGDQVHAVVADVRDDAALRQAVQVATTRFGGLDVVVAAAGVVAGGGPVWGMDDAQFEVVLGVNLVGLHRTATATMPALLARPAPRAGRFLAVASAAASLGLPRLAAYSAAKHGAVGYVKGLAADLAGTGITANAICPGSTDTAILTASAALYDLAEGAEGFAHHQLLGRLLTPQEPAALLAFLASEAASGITGAALAVDGGMTTS